MVFCVLFVFRMRCRARVAPPADEAEDEVSFQDEFLPPEPRARRRGRGKTRGRPCVAGRRRQRDLQDDEPAEQDDVSAEYMVETSQDTEPIPPAVPLMQQVYQQGMSDPETALFYARVDRISFDGTSDPLDFL